MGDEYIKKEDAIQSIIAHDLVGGDARGWAEYLLENTSTADVAPVRHGHWIHVDDVYDVSGMYRGSVWKCSECGYSFERLIGCGISMEMCHDCGARMDKEENDGQNDSDRQID